MLKLLLLVAFQTILLASCFGPENLGPGLFSAISIGPCQEGLIDEEKFKMEVKKHKLNRTHDGLSGRAISKIEINDKLGIYADVFKYVEGGCKPYQVVSDNNIVNFCNNYGGQNVEKWFTLAKIDPPNFPIPEGEHSFDDFTLDYCQFPRKSLYGTFKSNVYIMEQDKKVACLEVVGKFEEFEDENYCD